MEKQKQLPFIAIVAVGKTKEEQIDSLIKLEPILYFLGYDGNTHEVWNNSRMEYYKESYTQTIVCFDDTTYSYHNHTYNADKVFNADQLTKIINHVTNHNK